jgi:ABC-type lipoprotein release transport system permease subunit
LICLLLAAAAAAVPPAMRIARVDPVDALRYE